MSVTGLLALVAATAALAYAALLAARRLRGPDDPGVVHAVTVGLFLVVGILVVSLAVGVTGLYRPLPLALAAFALALAARLGLGNRTRAARRRPAARELLRLAAREPVAAAAVVLAALAALNRALIALVTPAGGFDAVAYHLVFVGDWVRRERIAGSELQEATCCAWYPVNAELTYAWLAVFPHSDRLVGVAQVAYLAWGALAVAGIALAAGAAGRWAVVAGSLYALTPAALRQSNLAYTDVALAAAVFVMTFFLLRLLRGGARPADVLRFGLAAALTLGMKGTALPYVAAACAVLVAGLLVRRARAAGRSPSGTAAARAAAVVGVLLVLGSGWYLRAWAETGNPVWPYRVEAAGLVLFDGPKELSAANPTPSALAGLPGVLHAPRSWAADLDVPSELRTDLPRDDARIGGLGLMWILLGLPCAVIALVLTLRRRDGRFGAFVLTIGLPALLAMPDPWWARFTIPLVAVGTVGLALVATRMSVAPARGLAVLALALALVGVLTTRPLGPLGELRETPGAPLARAPAHPDGLDYSSLETLPDEVRVGVLPGSPLLPYLVLGERFSREVVPLPDVRGNPVAVARDVDRRNLEYVVSRMPLREDIARAGGLALTAESSGAVVYRVAPPG